VVGVDGSGSALDAVRWAAREAERRQAPLRLVTVVTSAAAIHQFAYSGAGPDPRGPLLRQARTHLADAVRAAVDAAPGTQPEQEVLDGFPIPRLADESRAAQLVAIGDRGLGGVTGLLLGSVAFALGSQGTCPVVVVRGRPDRSDGPVVVGVDGSAISEAALAFAFEAAALRRAPLLAVHVWWDLLVGPVTLPEMDWDAVEQAEEAALTAHLAPWRDKHPDVDVEQVVVRGLAAEALVKRSGGAQLVVVGSHGRGGAAGLVIGSVSHAVLHRADCPVAIVRAGIASGEHRAPRA
jgi:nucleotide-binding universal stress UspA family protein